MIHVYYFTMYKEVMFDLETQRFFDEIDDNDPAKLGVSIISLYVRTLNQDFKEIEGQMFSYWENELDHVFPHFQLANRIIGFNSISFDTPVLQAYTTLPLSKLNHFDILDKVKEVHGRRVKLNSIAKSTLGHEKNDHGANAIKYWNEKTPRSLAKLKKYCEMDVAITRDIYDYARENGKLKFIDHWNTPRIIEVDFSYPKPPSESQASLF